MYYGSRMQLEEYGVLDIGAGQDAYLFLQNDCTVIGFSLIPFQPKGCTGDQPEDQDHKEQVVNRFSPEKKPCQENRPEQAVQDGKIVYRGTGEEVREFIHVQDAAQISVAILRPEFENQHIILTGAEKMRYIELLEMIREMLWNKIEIEILPSERKAHYKITPYNFSPKLGRKMVNNPHIDMGQGLLQCMAEIYEKVHIEKHEEMGLFVNGEHNE